jgi:hypothetical protein
MIKNIGTITLPAIVAGEKFGVYELQGNDIILAKSRHDTLHSVTLGGSRTPDAYHKKQHKEFLNELSTKKNYVYMHSSSIVFDPNVGSAGAFYRFHHSTKNFCVFKFYKVN